MELSDEVEISIEVTLPDDALWRQEEAVAAFNRGVQALQAGDVETGLASVRESADLNPSLPEAQLVLATVYRNQESWDAGLVALEAFLALRPEVAQTGGHTAWTDQKGQPAEHQPADQCKPHDASSDTHFQVLSNAGCQPGGFFAVHLPDWETGAWVFKVATHRVQFLRPRLLFAFCSV